MTSELDPQTRAYVDSQAVDGRVNVEFVTDDGMTLNIGPQHPATHGTLRLVVKLDGEKVVWADPVCGYMHRGYEKLVEVRTYPQINTLINRIDWLSSFCNEVPFILAAEKLLGVETPERAQWIRTLLFEMGRISNLMIFLGDMGLQLGAITPAFYAFRDREHVLNLIESATGGRFHPNFNRIGGVKEELPAGWIADCHRTMERVRSFCEQMHELLAGNEIFRRRTKGVGVIPANVGLGYGLSGANIRASGVDWDLRRDSDSALAWKSLDWTVHTATEGDAFARYWLRLKEVEEASRMVDQMLDGLPTGPIQAKVRKIIKVPAGTAWVNTENPLGEMGYFLVSTGGLEPHRVKIRSASFNNISILPWLLKDAYVPDVITILSSLYFILGDVDR